MKTKTQRWCCDCGLDLFLSDNPLVVDEDFTLCDVCAERSAIRGGGPVEIMRKEIAEARQKEKDLRERFAECESELEAIEDEIDDLEREQRRLENEMLDIEKQLQNI